MYEDFLDALRSFDGRATNKAMVEKLGWDKGDYSAIRQTLLDRGVVKLSRGRGGSVLLVGFDVANSEAITEKETNIA